jgi:hypothetical protein
MKSPKLLYGCRRAGGPAFPLHGSARVARVQRKRAATDLLGLLIVPALLEPERVHAEHIALVRHRFGPVGQDVCHAIAQHPRLIELKVAGVRHAQREAVARIVDQDFAV